MRLHPEKAVVETRHALTINKSIFIPGQGFSAHDLDMRAFPAHVDALSTDVLTLVQNRYRCCFPCPQELEHNPQDDQELQPS